MLSNIYYFAGILCIIYCFDIILNTQERLKQIEQFKLNQADLLTPEERNHLTFYSLYCFCWYAVGLLSGQYKLFALIWLIAAFDAITRSFFKKDKKIVVFITRIVNFIDIFIVLLIIVNHFHNFIKI